MLADHLLDLPRKTLAAVVHLGAGAGTELEAYQALQPQRLVLIEGDAETAAELRTLARRLPGAEMQECVVMPEAGEASWHRYNLPGLNGPRQATGLEPWFPRLRLLGRQPAAALALADVLRPLAQALPKGRRAALVFDVPGQEGELLAALPRELLHAFEWIVLRGCSAAADDASALTRTVQRLAAHGYAPQASRHEPDALWPVALLRFDAARYERLRLAERVALLERQLAERESGIKALSAERDVLNKRLADSESARERLSKDAVDRDARQHRLDSEILKAEAQLQLIRDVLIREKNF